MVEPESLFDTFKKKLEDVYGEYLPITSKFGTFSYGDISRELCISSSQFSKLISGSATEGMYIRTIRNLDQLQDYKQLKQIIQNPPPLPDSAVRVSKTPWWLLFTIGLLFGIAGYFIHVVSEKPINQSALLSTNHDEHPLEKFFDSHENIINIQGYLRETEVHEFCPASAFEGQWQLKKNYKIPLPGSKKPGLYLLAKSANVYMAVAKYAEPEGHVLIGLEYLTHEIWLDTSFVPLIPKYFNTKKRQFTTAYDSLVFERNKSFVRIAEIKSLYFDEFTIKKDSIKRQGQPMGRYVSFLDTNKAQKYQIDIAFILKNVISDLTKTQCQASENKDCIPKNIVEGTTMSFNCLYTIGLENLGYGGGYPYTKTLTLVKKSYSDNLLCNCDE